MFARPVGWHIYESDPVWAGPSPGECKMVKRREPWFSLFPLLNKQENPTPSKTNVQYGRNESRHE